MSSLHFGPRSDKISATQDFSVSEVGHECLGKECTRICDNLISNSSPNSKFLMVCCPCYNEEMEEMEKTLRTLLQNFEFLKNKTRFHDDEFGDRMRERFESFELVIVPIFDGIKPMSRTCKVWFNENFGNICEGIDGNENVAVRIKSSLWWHYCEDVVVSDVLEEAPGPSIFSIFHAPEARNASDAFMKPDNFMNFHIVPIIKQKNFRKHNSHHWFFEGICSSLKDRASLAFLTDCGTTYTVNCLARLCYELEIRTDLIGVTARQRVELPNNYFHPCESTGIPCFRSDHSVKGPKPCWKCYASYIFSPAPLQGFEFEGSLLLSTSLFNLVEALPVMPGPCQLLDWQKMKKYHIVAEYFNILFNEEPSGVISLKHLPRGFSPQAGSFGVDRQSFQENEKSRKERQLMSDPGKIKLSEFLRVNMRLAEDRILSFVSVFSTGYGTKWIPGATFFYQPELRFQSLLAQRRRWINGTFAAFIYFFAAKRASSRVSGGFFDNYKAGKNGRMVSILWATQLIQLVLLTFSPTVFGVAFYSSLNDVDKHSDSFQWVGDTIGSSGFISPQVIAISFYLLVYVVWGIYSYSVNRGVVPEYLCWFMVILGFCFMFPIYFSMFFSQGFLGTTIFLVLAGVLFIPVILAIPQSFKCAVLYMCYLPYFLIMTVFFLVYLPTYSFARIWDTTWGNRDTGRDEAISILRENTMKRYSLYALSVMLFSNVTITSILCAYVDKINSWLYFAVIFSPSILQLCGSFIYLFIVNPLRGFYATSHRERALNKAKRTENDNSA